MTFILENSRSGKTREFETRAAAEEQKQQMIGLGVAPEDLEIRQAENPRSDGGPDVDIVDHTERDEPETTEIINDPDKLSEDPIGWLESINNSFVNTIKGTPAISKQGFRFIQAQFGITTEAEVVQWIDDPTGCIVWAKAELPDGQSAEAHGEGYLSETKVDDNEFVRYADTRAKNRAISDLTSAGALAVSELSGEQ
ncbi:hypothetical protein OSG_eHP4_00195 [environmental Halophage eHP-4]|nr:hypothetical protein OSG_eHP4_00195 [environmental Halophage eHP-4]